MLKRFLLASLVMLAVSVDSRGDIIYSEPFTYTDGIAPPSPWALNTGAGGQRIQGNTLVMTPGAAGAVGDAVGTADYQRPFPLAVTTGTVFAGYDLVITSAPTDSGDNYFSHFITSGGVSSNTSRVFLNLITGNTNIGLSEAAGTAVSSIATPLALNTTFRVVQSYDLTAGSTSLWFNPTTTTALADLTDATGTGNATSITGFQFRINNASDGAKIIDNLIVATTFAEAANIAAIPEPSSIALVALVGFAGMAVRYRRNNAS
jgi:hypothetical protein